MPKKSRKPLEGKFWYLAWQSYRHQWHGFSYKLLGFHIVATPYTICGVQEVVIKLAFQATNKRCLIKKAFQNEFPRNYG